MAAGRDALVDVARAPAVDTVLAAIVGAAGLVPTLAAAEAGKRLLLANKEAVVCAGGLLMARRAARRRACCCRSTASTTRSTSAWPASANPSAMARAWCSRRRAVPSATGRTSRDVTPDEACAHPNWVMGRKISVDSATLMNKGLEVIEASWLFGIPVDRIDVVIHPQSVIHSMVEFPDGSVLAQMGTPDMRTPLAYALAWPERVASGAQRLDFTALERAHLRGSPTASVSPASALPMTRCATAGAPAPY